MSSPVVPSDSCVTRLTMNPRHAAAIPLLLAFVGALPAQRYFWEEVIGSVRPPARSRHAMVYDATRHVTVLFGGRQTDGQTSVELDDTWEFDGSQWTRRTPATSPSPRMYHSMVYDPIREVVMLIGGSSFGADAGDVWEWDGNDWRQVGTRFAEIVSGGSACYSPELGGVFFNHLDRNWIWDGSTWDFARISRRNSFTLQNRIAFHPPLGGIVGLAGLELRSFTVPLGWDTLIPAFTDPPSNSCFAADPVSGRMIVTGGRATDPSRSRTWVGTSSGFTEIPT